MLLVSEGVRKYLSDFSVDRPPPLGSHIFVEKEKRGFFKKPGQRLNMESTYTLSIFSSFLDLQGWRVSNLPGGSSVEFKSLMKKGAAVKLVCYETAHGSKTHRQREVCTFARFATMVE